MGDLDDHWPVDGVTDAARQAAVDAAAREGTPLGVWIEAAIREAVTSDAEFSAAAMADIAAAIDALAQRIADAEETTRRSVEPLRQRLAELSLHLQEIERARQLVGDGDNADQQPGDEISDPAAER